MATLAMLETIIHVTGNWKTSTANGHIELLDSIGEVNKAILNFRSTPRRDEVYGGQDDLTAAIGWESDGVTTVMFRKPASGAQVF